MKNCFYLDKIKVEKGVDWDFIFVFFFSSRRRHTRFDCDWSSDVCSSDLFERDERADAFVPHCLQRATGIAHAVFCETAANGIGDPTGQPFHARVSALRTITADKIRAASNFSRKSWMIGRIVLPIVCRKKES